MSNYYILDDDKNLVPTDDVLVWGRMFEDSDQRRVARTKLEEQGILVSTVFLGLDHQYGDGPPIVFETMTFGGEWDEWQWRYSTWDEAVKAMMKS